MRSTGSHDVPARVTRLSGGLDRSTLVVAGVATLGLVMAVLDTTIVNVALDTLAKDLHVSLAIGQWISTGYLLSLAAVIPISGWVTERFGSKPTWIASIALFAVGSALCALATSAAELIAFRVLQGLGGGMLVPVGFTLVAQSAGPQRVGRAFGLIGVPILLGPIFGPIIGGLIVDNAAWQWIFLVNVPIAVVAIAVAVTAASPDAGRADAGALDWIGVALLCPGLVGILLGLSETESHGGLGHPIAFGPIVAGVGPRRAVRLAQPACGAAADRCAAVPLTGVPRRRDCHLPLWGRVVRDAACAPALLPGGSRPERARRRAAACPAGPRGRTHAADQRPSDRPSRRRSGGGRRLLHHRSGDRAVGLRERPDAVRAARLRAVRPRPGPRRIDSANDRRGVRAARLVAGTARHRRAQHAPAGRRLDRHRAPCGRPPARWRRGAAGGERRGRRTARAADPRASASRSVDRSPPPSDTPSCGRS